MIPERYLLVVLTWMQAHGSSLILNYGEDTEHWECSWITSGTRYLGVRRTLPDAITECLKCARIPGSVLVQIMQESHKRTPHDV